MVRASCLLSRLSNGYFALFTSTVADKNHSAWDLLLHSFYMAVNLKKTIISFTDMSDRL
jgi:hypothetical protein